jgi:hypothetical protein
VFPSRQEHLQIFFAVVLVKKYTSSQVYFTELPIIRIFSPFSQTVSCGSVQEHVTTVCSETVERDHQVTHESNTGYVDCIVRLSVYEGHLSDQS